MKAYPSLLGIGIDEATAIVVQGSTAEVLGNGNVFFYDYKTPMTGPDDFLKMSKGDRYDLAARKSLKQP